MIDTTLVATCTRSFEISLGGGVNPWHVLWLCALKSVICTFFTGVNNSEVGCKYAQAITFLKCMIFATLNYGVTILLCDLKY